MNNLLNEYNNLKSGKEEQVFFCSAASRYFKEDIQASASNYQGFILLEHSDPFPEKINQAHFDKEWLKNLDLLAKKKNAKLLLIRNKKSDFKQCKIIYVDFVKERYTSLKTTLEIVSQIDFEEYLKSNNLFWEESPFFLVCTNGKKDKCCAKFGFPVFKFFEYMNTNVPIWECTHVGGDRYAANVVAMPFGIYYGHVAVEDVGHIMVRTLMRKIYKNKYRGLSIRSFFNQAVERYLRDHLQNYDIDFKISIKLLQEENRRYIVEAIVQNMTTFLLVLTQQTISYPHHLTCKSTKTGVITKYFLESIQKRTT